MHVTYFDAEKITDAGLTKVHKALVPYQTKIAALRAAPDWTQPEMSLFTWLDEERLGDVYDVAQSFKKVRHIILIGIGGSSLGTEAIHAALYRDGDPTLHVLDTIAPHEMQAVFDVINSVNKVEQLAVCIITKSGTTTETLANAATFLSELEERYGQEIYGQTVFIGDPGTPTMQVAKKLGAHQLAMPPIVGGRYSVFTPVGLFPLLLLGHDIEALLAGLSDATTEQFEIIAAENAARLYLHLKSPVRTVNFFAFDVRLVRLGKWYRQLTAESLGKETTRSGKPNHLGFVPTISTPVELHSVGQLYLSGFNGVYTDIVTFDDAELDALVPKKTKIAPALKGKSHHEIMTAIYGGVIGAYQERALPYRATQLDEDLAYSLGLFMGSRMLETMYVAALMDVNAFDQPNVELYKTITKKILGV